jgi:hypothetical protein
VFFFSLDIDSEKSSYAFEVYETMKTRGFIPAEYTYANLLKICYIFDHTDKLIPLWTEMKAMKHIEISRVSYFYMLQGLSKLALKDKSSKTTITVLLEELKSDVEKTSDLREERLFSSIAKVLYAAVSLEAAHDYINTTFAKYHIPITFNTQKALFKIACLRLDEKEIDAVWTDLLSHDDSENVDMWSWRLVAYINLYKFDQVLEILEHLNADFRSSLASKVYPLIHTRLHEIHDMEALSRLKKLCSPKAEAAAAAL